MTREDRVLSLLAGANPVPDPSSYAVDPDTVARLEAIEQPSMTMQESELGVIEPTAPRKPRRDWLLAAAAAILVLIVGLGGWALLRDGSDVVDSGEPTVTFDGATCSYEGPTEFELGAERVFTYINNSDTTSRLAVGPMPEGATLEDIGSVEFTAPGADLVFTTTGADPGEERSLDAYPSTAIDPAASDRSGEWVVVCQVADFNATAATQGGDYGAAVVQVTEG